MFKTFKDYWPYLSKRETWSWWKGQFVVVTETLKDRHSIFLHTPGFQTNNFYYQSVVQVKIPKRKKIYCLQKAFWIEYAHFELNSFDQALSDTEGLVTAFWIEYALFELNSLDQALSDIQGLVTLWRHLVTFSRVFVHCVMVLKSLRDQISFWWIRQPKIFFACVLIFLFRQLTLVLALLQQRLQPQLVQLLLQSPLPPRQQHPLFSQTRLSTTSWKPEQST